MALADRGFWLGNGPVINSMVKVRHYKYPVVAILHEDGPLDFVADPEPTCVFVFRDQSDEVRFLQSGEAFAKLLECAASNANGSYLQWCECAKGVVPQGRETLKDPVAKTPRSTKFGLLNGSTKPFRITEFVSQSIFATESN